MSRARSMTPLQLADAVARERDGRPDIAAMSDEERRAAGCMTLREAVEWERLPIVPCARPGERTHGPDPDDIWALPAGGDSDG
ncbi:MAG TPA: hypothetical protein VGS62_02350 [Streptosporangiaceae bacterium]|nr:hypothetical protein [Streptosporangiaceae bacterium]